MPRLLFLGTVLAVSSQLRQTLCVFLFGFVEAQVWFLVRHLSWVVAVVFFSKDVFRAEDVESRVEVVARATAFPFCPFSITGMVTTPILLI